MAGSEGAAAIDQFDFLGRDLDILDDAEVDPAPLAAVLGRDLIQAERRRSGNDRLRREARADTGCQHEKQDERCCRA